MNPEVLRQLQPGTQGAPPRGADACTWATARPRVIALTEDARPLWRIVRSYARILGETLPEEQAVFIERPAEQALRVAACLATSESITEEILAVAFRLVRRSVQDTVRTTKGATSPKTNRQPEADPHTGPGTGQAAGACS
ncbi:hypothetical protein [Streptomyces sp. NBRC 110465]|uniref:hypothetical protein n=1 Tax=Streptomyces sp. NBRC 110465 TaxID=1897621 RepID=UPI001F1CA909|nr:hypothetical protein [Streptomyces sp. NBRC 110465]